MPKEYKRHGGSLGALHFSVGDSHGKFVVEEELEVSL
jgi:hypothetical protein